MVPSGRNRWRNYSKGWNKGGLMLHSRATVLLKFQPAEHIACCGGLLARTHWLQVSQATQSVAASSPKPQMAHTTSRCTSSGCA